MRREKERGGRKSALAAVVITFIHLAAVLPAGAAIVELDLFSIGCETIYNPDSGWSTDFDLGVTFSSIDHVYIDWEGQITGGRAIDYSDPENPFPIDVGIGSYLGTASNWRHVTLWGGGATYPTPESFDVTLEFIYGSMSWSELYDGQGKISIGYTRAIILNGEYI